MSEWISASDKLPETNLENTHDGDVLLYIPKRDGVEQSGIYLGKLRPTKEDEEGSHNIWRCPIEACDWTVWGWSYFERPIVTHWMKLPEPPNCGVMANVED